MPADQRPVVGSHPTRRQLLRTAATAGALTGLAGCSLRVGQPSRRSATATPGADELARERVAEQSDALAASASSIVAAPAVAAELARIVQQHREHAAALRPVQPGSSGTPSSGVPSGSAPSHSGPAVPASVAAALGHQAAAERAGATDVEPELAAVSGDVARLLASIAACRTLHAQTLQQLAARAHP